MTKYFLDDIDRAPELVEDERIKISIPIYISGSTYYYGYMYGMTDENIIGAQSSVGAWTNIEKGGTQYEIISEGLPLVLQALIDFQTGRILTTSQTTLYLTYYDYSRIYKWYEIGGEFIIHKPGIVLDCVTDTLFFERKFSKPTRYIGAAIISETQVEDDITFTIKNDTVSDSKTLTLAKNNSSNEIIFNSPLCLQKDDVLKIVVGTNSYNCTSPTLILQAG